MKKLFIVLSLVYTSSTIFSQEWNTKEIENNIFVKFPQVPQYNVNTLGESVRYSYVYELDGCYFFATVIKNIIPIKQFTRIKFSQKLNKEMAKSYFNNYINEIKTLTSNEITSYPININNNEGVKFTTSMINPINGAMQTMNVQLFYFPQRNLSVEFRTLSNNQIQLETQFFNSINFK